MQVFYRLITSLCLTFAVTTIYTAADQSKTRPKIALFHICQLSNFVLYVHKTKKQKEKNYTKNAILKVIFCMFDGLTWA